VPAIAVVVVVLFDSVTLGFDVFVKVQVMLSPATGVTGMLVPVPDGIVVPPASVFVQLYVLV
jgi:hypothetical protein